METKSSSVFSVRKDLSPASEGLWKRFRETGDDALRHQLILDNVKLVHFAYGRIKQHLPAGMEREDAISYGVAGLIEAVDRYDVTKGRFATLAYPRIRGAICDGILQFGWDTRHDRRREIRREPLPLEEIWEVAEEHPEFQPENALMRRAAAEMVAGAMAELTAQEKEVVRLRYFEGLNLSEIARTLQKSNSRVGEIHRKALAKMREKLEKSS